MCFNCNNETPAREHVVLITGSTGELGVAMVAAFAAGGYPVLAIDRCLPDQAEENCRVLHHAIDTAALDQTLDVIRHAETEFGPVDCFIDCIGWHAGQPDPVDREGIAELMVAVGASMARVGRGSVIAIARPLDTTTETADALRSCAMADTTRIMKVTLGSVGGTTPAQPLGPKMKAGDIATLILACYRLPQEMCARELRLVPTGSEP